MQEVQYCVAPGPGPRSGSPGKRMVQPPTASTTGGARDPGVNLVLLRAGLPVGIMSLLTESREQQEGCPREQLAAEPWLPC